MPLDSPRGFFNRKKFEFKQYVELLLAEYDAIICPPAMARARPGRLFIRRGEVAISTREQKGSLKRKIKD
jgi:hypothetical protein